MTLKKLSLYSVFLWVILGLLKVWFLNNNIFGSPILQEWVFWLLIAAVAIALIRRFGIISFFEAIFILFIWIIGSLLVDLLITATYTGDGIFSRPEYWFGYLFIIVGAMVFHKKRHIHMRHELHAKAHAAAHPHSHKEHKH